MKSEKGQSLVEFALVVPILMLLLFGIADFGLAFHKYLTIDHAGREAARVASLHGTEVDVIHAAIQNGASINLTSDHVDPQLGTESGDEVRIVITYPVEFITPFISNIIDDFVIENTTVMRLE